MSINIREKGLRGQRSAAVQWALLLLAASTGAAAQTFKDAVELARTTEPAYLSAKANAAAAGERSKAAFGALLPQVSATANTNANRRDYLTRIDPAPPSQIDHYNSNNAQLQLTQPLYRPSNVIALRQAQTVVSQSDYQLAAAEQELLAKLVIAWLDTMAARDSMLFTARQAAATKQQADILRRGAELGTASAPAFEEAMAKHEQALADRVAAEMEFHIRIAALEQVVGPIPRFTPPFLSRRPHIEIPPDGSLEEWVEWSGNSPQVMAAAQALSAAHDEVRKQRAGHHPTLDLVGSYGRNNQQVGNFPGQSGYAITQGVIGLQLNVPLYAGGAQLAKVDEAVALRQKALHELTSAQRSARLAAKQAWYQWQAANARRNAALQAAKAALAALRAATVGIASGLKTELDRLQAQQQLEGARRDFNKARYDVIASLVRLKAAAGRLADADIVALERVFNTQETELHELVSMN